MTELIVGVIAGIVGLAIGYLIDRVIKGGAYKTRDEIVQQAQRDAENVRKNEELKLKEDMLRRREELDAKIEESRGQLRTRERELDKQQAALEEQQESFRKKERMLQQTQQKLADRTKALEVKEGELNRLLKEEQEVLYKISELRKIRATERTAEATGSRVI